MIDFTFFLLGVLLATIFWGYHFRVLSREGKRLRAEVDDLTALIKNLDESALIELSSAIKRNQELLSAYQKVSDELMEAKNKIQAMKG